MRCAQLLGLFLILAAVSLADDASNARPTKDDADLKYWLLNMRRHGYSLAEQAQTIGRSEEDTKAAAERLLKPEDKLPVGKDVVELLPYPGGRHPRIGFLDGAVDPQRETKL